MTVRSTPLVGNCAIKRHFLLPRDARVADQGCSSDRSAPGLHGGRRKNGCCIELRCSVEFIVGDVVIVSAFEEVANALPNSD